jgi:hypothetical protein
VALRIAIPATCLLLCLAGCATDPQRPAPSSAGCARAVVARLPPGLSDPEKHCVASAGIARQCSPFEAWLAGWGKEAQDALGRGDASREDLEANRIGRDCALADGAPDAALECCRHALAGPRDQGRRPAYPENHVDR